MKTTKNTTTDTKQLAMASLTFPHAKEVKVKAMVIQKFEKLSCNEGF